METRISRGDFNKRLLIGLGTLYAASRILLPSSNPPAIEIKLISPTNGGEVKTSTDVRGTVNTELPSGSSIWVVLRGEGDPHLHPQREPAHFIDNPPRHWLLENARFGYEENAGQKLKFDVYAVLADSVATSQLKQYLEDGAKGNNFPGLLELPRGSQIMDTISVTRPSEGYPLTPITEEGQPMLVDQQLERAGVIGRLRFQYDTKYRPNNAPNGAIGLEVVRTTEGPVRIMSEELKPNPRFLLNDVCPYSVKAGEKLYRWPVIDLGKNDLQRVFVGSNQNTYQGMRVYEIQRSGDLLVGSFMGIRDMDPAKIHPEQTPKPC